jgi:hypothetical protein
VVVAVASVGVVQMTGDQVIDVVTVRDRLVSAALAVDVIGGVIAALMIRRAAVGMRGVDGHHVLVDVPVVGVVQMTVVNVVRVVPVHDGDVPATGTVLVRMIFVNCMLAHVVEANQQEWNSQAVGSENRSQLSAEVYRSITSSRRQRVCSRR